MIKKVESQGFVHAEELDTYGGPSREMGYDVLHHNYIREGLWAFPKLKRDE